MRVMTLDEAVWQDPERMSGALCFRGTRITVKTLFDHLAHDELGEFRIGFPDVSDAMIQAVLQSSFELLDSEFKEKKSA